MEIVNEMLRHEPTLQAGELAKHARISRQAAHRHLARLVREKILLRQGQGRGSCYRAVNPPEGGHRYRRKGLAEEAVWGDDCPDSDSLRSHVHQLRQVIDKPFSVALLHTVHGVGYRLAEEPNGV